MSKSYRNDEIPKYIIERRDCTLRTLRALKDALCEVGYTPFSIKNSSKAYDRKSVPRFKRIGKRLELDRSFGFGSSK